jgi:hypothetical protein
MNYISILQQIFLQYLIKNERNITLTWPQLVSPQFCAFSTTVPERNPTWEFHTMTQVGASEKYVNISQDRYLLFPLSIEKPLRISLFQKLQQLAEYVLSQCWDLDATIQGISPSIQVSPASYCH